MSTTATRSRPATTKTKKAKGTPASTELAAPAKPKGAIVKWSNEASPPHIEQEVVMCTPTEWRRITKRTPEMKNWGVITVTPVIVVAISPMRPIGNV